MCQFRIPRCVMCRRTAQLYQCTQLAGVAHPHARLWLAPPPKRNAAPLWHAGVGVFLFCIVHHRKQLTKCDPEDQIVCVCVFPPGPSGWHKCEASSTQDKSAQSQFGVFRTDKAEEGQVPQTTKKRSAAGDAHTPLPAGVHHQPPLDTARPAEGSPSPRAHSTSTSLHSTPLRCLCLSFRAPLAPALLWDLQPFSFAG